MSTVSIVIPVHNGGEQLRTCLRQISLSSAKPAEIIVVDDNSTDESPNIAKEFGATVVPTAGRRGPAYARNIGARHATGDILFFLDADVAVHRDTIGRVREAFEGKPGVDALLGSYDNSPANADFLSQYRNLMHHFVHQSARQEAFTFWSGCGAIRRELFLEYSGFDESYGRPMIEDIELGYRLQRTGRRIVLDRDIQVTHLKRWTFWGLVKTDVFDRGIPWTELILRDHRMPNDLNLQVGQRISVALVFLMIGLAMLTAIYWRGYFLVPVFALLFFLLGRFWVEGGTDVNHRNATIPVLSVGGVLILLAWWHHMLGLIPPLLLSCFLFLMRDRYSLAGREKKLWTRLFYAGALAISVITSLIYLPAKLPIFAVFAIGTIVILLNTQFYVFLANRRGRLFAAAALPFHLLFLYYSGLSFLIGMIRFYCRTVRRDKAGRSRAANL